MIAASANSAKKLWPTEYEDEFGGYSPSISDLASFIDAMTNGVFNLNASFSSVTFDDFSAAQALFHVIQRFYLAASTSGTTVYQFNEISEDVFLVTVKARNVQVLHDSVYRWMVGPCSMAR